MGGEVIGWGGGAGVTEYFYYESIFKIKKHFIFLNWGEGGGGAGGRGG